MPGRQSSKTRLAVSPRKRYTQSSSKKRIEAFFLDNLGKIVTTDQLKEVAKDPVTKKPVENWHQRLSELRVNDGYNILSHRDLESLKTGQYLLKTKKRNKTSAKRIYPNPKTWQEVLERADHSCQWHEEGKKCSLKEGEKDPIGGGRVVLTADHKTPHSIDPNSSPDNADDWQVLCQRHQVTKRNYWDSKTGKLNAKGIVQAASKKEKEEIFDFLLEYNGFKKTENGIERL